MSVKKFFDPGFGKKIKWDIDLLKGYKYDFLKFIGSNKVGNIFPITTEFINKIFNNKTDIIWLHGVKNWYNLCIIVLSKFFKKKVFVRDEVHQFSKNRTVFNNPFGVYNPIIFYLSFSYFIFIIIYHSH